MAQREFRYTPGQVVPGTQLRIVRPIGYGGMGAIYECEETFTELRYVLKVIHPELVAGKGMLARMENEAKVLARLRHPNIIQIFWAGFTDESPKLFYYLMEKLNGYSLRRLCRKALEQNIDLPIDSVLNIAIRILRGLDYAHRNDIIHRDIKPDNVFVHSGTKIKLLDFGIVVDRGKQRTTARGFVGTVGYAPPELFTGGEITPAADLWSVGIVLFELLTRQMPFGEAPTEYALAQAVLTAPPRRPNSLRSDIPQALDALLMSLLEKDPKRRPADAHVVAAQLSRIRSELTHGGAERELVAPALIEGIGPPSITNVEEDDEEGEGNDTGGSDPQKVSVRDGAPKGAAEAGRSAGDTQREPHETPTVQRAPSDEHLALSLRDAKTPAHGVTPIPRRLAEIRAVLAGADATRPDRTLPSGASQTERIVWPSADEVGVAGGPSGLTNLGGLNDLAGPEASTRSRPLACLNADSSASEDAKADASRLLAAPSLESLPLHVTTSPSSSTVPKPPKAPRIGHRARARWIIPGSFAGVLVVSLSSILAWRAVRRPAARSSLAAMRSASALVATCGTSTPATTPSPSTLVTTPTPSTLSTAEGPSTVVTTAAAVVATSGPAESVFATTERAPGVEDPVSATVDTPAAAAFAAEAFHAGGTTASSAHAPTTPTASTPTASTPSTSTPSTSSSASAPPSASAPAPTRVTKKRTPPPASAAAAAPAAHEEEVFGAAFLSRGKATKTTPTASKPRPPGASDGANPNRAAR